MRRPIDPKLIFKHALGFVQCARLLRLQTNLSKQLYVIPALLVMEVFAIELLLKCTLVIEGKIPPKHHLLDKLFLQLSLERRQSIVNRWDTSARSRLEPLGKELKLPTDLPSALGRCNKAFEELRYGYEHPDQMCFYLGDLPEILVTEIVKLRQNWVQFGEAP